MAEIHTALLLLHIGVVSILYVWLMGSTIGKCIYHITSGNKEKHEFSPNVKYLGSWRFNASVATLTILCGLLTLAAILALACTFFYPLVYIIGGIAFLCFKHSKTKHEQQV